VNISGFWPIFGVAAGGGALAELLKWYQLREATTWPSYVRHPAYWLLTAAMIIAGGLLAVLYGTADKQALLVVNIGVSAPVIIRALASNQPPSERRGRGNTPREATVVNFLAAR
jgi:hypothetical protein